VSHRRPAQIRFLMALFRSVWRGPGGAGTQLAWPQRLTWSPGGDRHGEFRSWQPQRGRWASSAPARTMQTLCPLFWASRRAGAVAGREVAKRPLPRPLSETPGLSAYLSPGRPTARAGALGPLPEPLPGSPCGRKSSGRPSRHSSRSGCPSSAGRVWTSVDWR
jgi:hypothetical protein